MCRWLIGHRLIGEVGVERQGMESMTSREREISKTLNRRWKYRLQSFMGANQPVRSLLPLRWKQFVKNLLCQEGHRCQIAGCLAIHGRRLSGNWRITPNVPQMTSPFESRRVLEEVRNFLTFFEERVTNVFTLDFVAPSGVKSVCTLMQLRLVCWGCLSRSVRCGTASSSSLSSSRPANPEIGAACPHPADWWPLSHTRYGSRFGRFPV